MVCQNCNNVMSKNHNYCESCGGKVIRNRLTMKNLFADLSEQFFNYDNTFIKTFIALFKKPEEVIGGYINGMRKRYVNPISYLALTITIGGIYILVLDKYFPNAMTEMSSLGVKGQEKAIKETIQLMQKYYSFIMVLLVPFYALMSRLIFINRKEFNYTEHIVIIMYIVAQFSLVSSFINIALLVLQLPTNILGSASIFLQIAYFGYCFKRLYKLSFRGIIMRTLFFFGILIAIFIVFFILGIIMAILFKDSAVIQNFIEAQKPAI